MQISHCKTPWFSEQRLSQVARNVSSFYIAFSWDEFQYHSTERYIETGHIHGKFA